MKKYVKLLMDKVGWGEDTTKASESPLAVDSWRPHAGKNCSARPGGGKPGGLWPHTNPVGLGVRKSLLRFEGSGGASHLLKYLVIRICWISGEVKKKPKKKNLFPSVTVYKTLIEMCVCVYMYVQKFLKKTLKSV